MWIGIMWSAYSVQTIGNQYSIQQPTQYVFYNSWLNKISICTTLLANNFHYFPLSRFEQQQFSDSAALRVGAVLFC